MEDFIAGDIMPEIVERSLRRTLEHSQGDIEEPAQAKIQDVEIDVIPPSVPEPEENNDALSTYKDQLGEGDILISAINCAVMLSPKERLINNKIITVILDKDDKSNIMLYAGSRFTVYIKNMEQGVTEYPVYYSGIDFIYEKNRFLIFHICQE